MERRHDHLGSTGGGGTEHSALSVRWSRFRSGTYGPGDTGETGGLRSSLIRAYPAVTVQDHGLPASQTMFSFAETQRLMGSSGRPAGNTAGGAQQQSWASNFHNVQCRRRASVAAEHGYTSFPNDRIGVLAGPTYSPSSSSSTVKLTVADGDASPRRSCWGRLPDGHRDRQSLSLTNDGSNGCERRHVCPGAARTKNVPELRAIRSTRC